MLSRWKAQLFETDGSYTSAYGITRRGTINKVARWRRKLGIHGPATLRVKRA